MHRHDVPVFAHAKAFMQSVFEHLQNIGFTDDGFAGLDIKTATSLLLSTARPYYVTSGRTM